MVQNVFPTEDFIAFPQSEKCSVWKITLENFGFREHEAITKVLALHFEGSSVYVRGYHENDWYWLCLNRPFEFFALFKKRYCEHFLHFVQTERNSGRKKCDNATLSNLNLDQFDVSSLILRNEPL